MVERNAHPLIRALVPVISVYALVVPLAFGFLGPAVGILPASSVLIAAWLLGRRAALIAAVLAVIASTAAYVAAGDALEVALRASAIASGFFLAIGMLIARIRADKTRVERLTLFDPVTDLPRRYLFDEQIERMIGAGRRAHVALVEVVELGMLSESFGQDVGDQVVGAIAERLTANFKQAVIARLGTDEFGVLIPAAGTDADFAGRVLDVFREPFLIGGSLLTVEGLVGIARSPEHGGTSASLRSAAASAAMSMRQHGSGWATASETHLRDTAARLKTLGELRQALERGELRLHYQPLLDLTSRKVLGFEALMRWQRNGELVPPAEFIPLAERTGLIVPLTDWLVDEAMRQSAEWARVGHPVGISINVGARAFGASSHLETVIAKAVADHSVTASHLTLEVTETDVMTDPVQASRTLAAIKKLGVRVAVDDFGTGYSSLSYLNQLPLDEVKIDRSFIGRLLRDPQTSSIVRTAIDLSHALGLEVVAEGIEDEATLERLRLLGCDRAQGYFIARPMPADAVLPWLQRYVPTPAATAPAPSAPIPTSAFHDANGGTVLIVDDEPSLRIATHRMLSSQGFNVLHAATASEALRISNAQRGGIDLVVTDIFLTDQQGPELAGRLREAQPRAKFLFVSGDPMGSKLVNGAAFLAKPFSKQQLIDRVGAVMAA